MGNARLANSEKLMGRTLSEYLTTQRVARGACLAKLHDIRPQLPKCTLHRHSTDPHHFCQRLCAKRPTCL